MKNDIDLIKKKALEEKVPIIKDEGLEFLLDFIKKKGFKEILELGTAVGYSAMKMASLDKDIHIDTIEKNEEMYLQAKENISKSPYAEQIDLYFMPIEEFESEKMYDFIFVDAAKAQYGKYMEQFLANLKEKGFMFFDNMIFHGLVFEVDNIESKNLRNLVKKIINFKEKVLNDERFDIMFFDNIGDGILLLSRRESGS